MYPYSARISISIILYMAFLCPWSVRKRVTHSWKEWPLLVLGHNLDWIFCTGLDLAAAGHFWTPCCGPPGDFYSTVTTFRRPEKAHPQVSRLAITMQLSYSIYILVGAIVAPLPNSDTIVALSPLSESHCPPGSAAMKAWNSGAQWHWHSSGFP